MNLSSNKVNLRKQLISEFSNEKLTTEDLVHIGETLYGKASLLSFFGLNPKQLLTQNIKINARSAAESAVDVHATKMVALISKDLEKLNINEYCFIDAFTGIGNITFHVHQKLKPKKIISSDKNPSVYASLKENFTTLGVKPLPFFFGGDLLSNDRLSAIVGDFDNVVIYIDPPIGEAFDPKKGLNLKKTRPGVDQIISNLKGKLGKKNLLFIIKTHENLIQESVDQIITEGNLKLISQKTLTGTADGSNVGYLSLTN